MKKIITFALAALIALSSAFSVSGNNVDAYIIPLTSGIYDDIDALYLISGKSIPSASRPWSYSEAEMIFNRLNTEDVGETLYNTVKAELESYKPKWAVDEGFGLGLNMIITPEIYTHTNSEDFTTDTDWSYTYDDRPVAAAGTIDLAVNDFFYSYSEFTFGISRYQQKGLEFYDPATYYPNGIGAIIPPYGSTDEESNDAKVVSSSHLYKNKFSTNIPALVDVLDIDFTFPKRAIVSLGGANWNLLFGRDRVNWGGSNIGNFVFDDHVGYHEVLRATAYTSKFKYDWTNLFLETIPNVTENDDSITEEFKVMMNHRLEFRPTEAISFAVSESIMYIGHAFEVQNFNPAYIYHQLNNRAMFNSLASLEFYATPIDGLNLYFEFGLDNATLPNEGTSQADANGFLVGAEYAMPLSNGYLETAIEYAKTSPIMYRRDGVDFLMLQRSYTLGAEGGNSIAPKLYYIGFPYGQDAKVLHLGATYKVPSSFELAFDANFVTKGEVTMFQSHNKDGNNDEKANLTGKTPSGDKHIKAFELSLNAKYEVPSFVDWMDMTVNANLAYVGKKTYTPSTDTYSDEVKDLQFALGVAFKF